MVARLSSLLEPRPRLGHMDISQHNRSVKVTIMRDLSKDPLQRRAEIESIKNIFNDGLATLLARLEQ